MNSVDYKNKQQSLKFGKGLQILVFTILVAILGIVSFLYFRIKNREISLDKIEEAQKKEAQELVKKLRHHIVLPTDEEPIIATIIDAEKLKTKSKFYELAQNGFKVILFKNRGILYDKEYDIIVNIAEVSWDEPKESE